MRGGVWYTLQWKYRCSRLEVTSMQCTIFESGSIRFWLETEVKEEEGGSATTARILRKDAATDTTLTLMSYTWPKQLIPEVTLKAPGSLNEKGWLSFTLSLEVHHISGMVQGEFSEEQDYLVLDPLTKDPVCTVEDIRRKTKFALAERHLEHTPHRTYPPTDGMQGPYGHPAIRSLPPMKKAHPEK